MSQSPRPPSWEKLIEQYGSSDKIPPDDRERFDAELKAWHNFVRFQAVPSPIKTLTHEELDKLRDANAPFEAPVPRAPE